MWQAFELQVATGGAWKNIFATSGNNLDVTKYLGPAVVASVLRIRMTKAFLLINGTSLQISFRFVCVRSHIQPWGLAMDIPCELPRIKNCRRLKTLVGPFPHRYAMKNIQVLATSIQMVVQDCTEAEENTDARDKFFMCVSKFAVPD